MNKYLIPICDIEAGHTWIHRVVAKSISECKEKLMSSLMEDYDLDFGGDYSEFIEWMNTSQNIIIGYIEDIEEI